MEAKIRVKQFISTELLKNSNRMPLGDQTSLIESGVIDSIGIMKLINFVEEVFSFKVSDDQIVPENFETTEAIATFIEKNLN